MNYRFGLSELIVLKLSTSGTVIVCEPDSREAFEFAKKSIMGVLQEIILKPQLRTVQHEQNFLKVKKRIVTSTRARKRVRGKLNPSSLLSSDDCADSAGRAAAYRALCMVERIRLCYSSIGVPLPFVCNSTKEVDKIKYATLLLQWCYLYLNGEAEKVAKFQSVSMFNKVMNVEPLESISLPFGWRTGCLTPWGSLHVKVLRKLAKSSRSEVFRLSQCFLYFKKGCPKSSENFVKETLKKHKIALTKPAPVVDTYYDDRIVVPRSAIKERLNRIVYDVFRNYREPTKLWEPSFSSSFLKKKKQGGSMSEINFSAPGWGWKIEGKRVIELDKWGLPTIVSKVEWVYSCLDFENYEWFDTSYDLIRVPIVVLPSAPVTKHCEARPVALTEPLKVRVITCESAWCTYFLAGAQKSLWECLHRHPWFALTGRPVNVSDIPVCPDGVDYISVDYSAATDNLSKEFSRLAIQAICDLTGLPFDLCFDSLCNHKIKYDDGEVDQTNGQMMGSILSFIVLCICNAVVISLSVNPGTYDPFISICVNGDDGLFLGGDQEYYIWKKLSSHVGLAPSIGKVYRSREFCVINSTLFYKDNDIGLVRECPYPNASGMMQFDARTSSVGKTPWDLKDSHSLWMSGFLVDTERKMAEDLWYTTFKDLLGTDWINGYNIDYHLPQSLGGLGLPPRTGVEETPVCREALARARLCLVNGPIYSSRKTGLRTDGKTPLGNLDKLFNPFMEKATYRKITSFKPLSEETCSSLKVLRYTKPVEVVRPDPETYDWATKAHQGGSSVSTCLLSGVSIMNASECTIEKVRTLRGDTRKLRRDRSLQHYWEGYVPILPSTLSTLEVVSGSRVIKSWSPSIPPFDPILDRHYSRMLSYVDQQRTV